MADPGEHVSAADAGANAAASAAAFLDEAREKIKNDDAPGALICLRTVAGLAGAPAEALIDAAKLLAQNGDTETAINAYIVAGNAYLGQRKEYQKARQAFQAAHGLDVHNLDVIYMLGQADVEDGRLQDGLAKFIDVLRKSNLKHLQALFAAGCIYQQNGQFDQAMLAFKKVLDRDKDHVQATVRIGQLYQSKELMADAIGFYIQAAQLARECQHWSSARQIATMVLAIDAQNQKARILLDELDEQGHGADEVGPAEPIAPPLGPPAAAQRHTPEGAKHARPAVPAAVQKPLERVAASATSKPSANADKRPDEAAVSARAQAQAPQPVPAKPVTPPLVAQVAAKQSPPRAEAAQPSKPEAAKQPAAAESAPSGSPADVDRARQMLSAIEAQRQAAQQDLQLLLQTRSELQKALAEQRTLLETATMRKSDLDVQLESAQAKLVQAQAAGAEAAAQSGDDKQQMVALAAERAALEAALRSLKAEAEELGAQKLAQEAALREVSLLRDQTAAEVSALTAKMQDAKRLTDELEAMRSAAGDAQAQAAQAQTISAELIALEDRRSKLQDEIGSAQQALADLRAQIEQATTDAAEAAAARDKARAEAEELDARVQQLSAAAASIAQIEPPKPGGPTTPMPPSQEPPQSAHAVAAAQLAAGEYEKAAESYRQALEADPQDAAAAYQAGALLAEHGGDLESAERLLAQAAELRPEHAATRYELALVKARRGNVVEGAEMLTSMVRSDANNADFIDQFIERLEKDAASGGIAAKYRLGLAYRELGRIEEALVALQAIQHEPEMVVPCLIAIGACLRRQGLDGAAAKRFAKAIETPGYAEPLYLEALYNLGELYEAKGTQESLALALSSFEELYARDLTYRDIGERVRVVKTNLSSAERQKVKRLPTRVADSQGNQ
ncbi:MAG: tetratricopeptide repeat protein [Candidatus Eremiobacteraeota bacterium]|nr:tetratricopeptide repeat protein [Candidatus Eremiobacteraeota bacterium]